MIESYIIRHYSVLPEQRELVERRCFDAGLSGVLADLVKHVIASNEIDLIGGRDRDHSPVPSETIKKYLRGASMKKITALVDITPYSRIRHLCTEGRYRFLDEFLDLADRLPVEEYAERGKVDLFTGRKYKVSTKSKLYDKNGNKIPSLVAKAVRSISRCVYDRAAVENHLALMRDAEQRAARDFGVDSERHTKALKRLHVDIGIYRSAAWRDKDITTHIGNGICQFPPVYTVSKSGRIYGGFQSATRLMKKAAFWGISELHNYDLKSSQPNALLLELDEAGLPLDNLLKYLTRKDAKEVYAEMAGMPADCFKACFIPMCMGAHLPRTIRNLSNKKSAILNTLAKYAGGDIDQIETWRAGFEKVVGPIHEEILAWVKWLFTKGIKEVRTFASGKVYLPNKCDMKLCLSNLPDWRDKDNGWKTKSSVTAFLLQGREAAYSHHLTILSERYSYEVLENEHDGLVVHETIPIEAQMEAAQLSGFSTAQLVEKRDYGVSPDYVRDVYLLEDDYSEAYVYMNPEKALPASPMIC